MTITKSIKDHVLHLAVEGRLDTNTAPQLEEEIKNSMSGIREMELDFANLQYISSAGLRVLLSAHKSMSKQGSMTIYHANEAVMEVFDITGFSDILTLK